MANGKLFLSANLALAAYAALPDVMWLMSAAGIQSVLGVSTTDAMSGWFGGIQIYPGGPVLHFVLIPGWVIASSAFFWRVRGYRLMAIPLAISVVVALSTLGMLVWYAAFDYS